MKTPLVFATGNRNKLQELKAIFDLKNIPVLSLDDFPAVPPVVEDGETFEENAAKKALEYASVTGQLTLADDSGLCVDYLDGAPGIYSSRYAGEEGNGPLNCRKLLEALKDCPPQKRTAHFTAVLALARPGELITTVRGECHGVIADSTRGQSGFGYDPLFYYPPLGCTFGELEPAKKNRLSHRYQALIQMQEFLKGYLQMTRQD